MTTTDIAIERDTMVPLRDGARLATDVYRPARAGRVPVLLQRIPYGKGAVSLLHTFLIDPIAAVERGFAVVVQDTRGCGASEGEFDPIFQERADGHDTLEWIASQAWCDGNVGIYGSSYMGVAALQACVQAPVALKACVAYLTSGSFTDSWVYCGGAFELGFQLRWSMGAAAVRKARCEFHDAGEEARVQATLDEFARDPLAFYSSSCDPSALPGPCTPLIPYYTRNLSHTDYDDHWAAVDVVAAADRVSVPVMQIAGWYDAFLKSGIDLHGALVTRGAPALRSSHMLIIGPWDHSAYLGSQTLTKAGMRSFGASAVGGQPGMQARALAWFDRWLRPARVAFEESGTVRYFQMGPNRWAETPNWPPSSARDERWYLHSGGHAQTRAGDGLLERRPAQDEPPDSYVYDPQDPAPTLGGRHLMYDLPSGVHEQRQIEERDDVLVYTSPALLAPVTVAGGVKAELYVSSSAPTTDFVAVLVDVRSDGAAENVAEGILRLRVKTDEPAGSLRLARIDLWHTSYTFEVGHRLRLHVTSSNFPRFDRNRNLSSDDGPADATAIAVQHVHHSAACPSALVIECVPV